MRLLFVCTGNVCRSPLAERLIHAWAARVPGSAIRAASAGLGATLGAPMDTKAAEALRRLGGDPTGFGARPVTEAIALDADLVLTMTRKHRAEVLKLTPRGLRRTFTLLEATSLLELADVSDLPQGSDRAREFGLRLDVARRLRVSTGADDVPDPIGLSNAAHRQIAGSIADALRPLADVLLDSPIDPNGPVGALADRPVRAAAVHHTSSALRGLG